jgi:hypothetical protein
MGQSSINVYVEGNRVKVTATTKTLSPDTLATPTTWRLLVRNLNDDSLLTFSYDGAVSTLPTGVEAAMDNPSVGVIHFLFDIDTHGERAVYFSGTGACKCAAETAFKVSRSRAK